MEKLGIRKDRLRLEWISAAEGIRFAGVMNDMENLRKAVTVEEIAGTIRILKERKKKK
jgi:heterodisulfide reductase subunit A